MTTSFKKMLEEAKKQPEFWHSNALFDVTEKLWELYEKKGYIALLNSTEDDDFNLDYEKIGEVTKLHKRKVKGIFNHADNVTVLDLVKLALPFKMKIKITLEEMD